MNLKREICNIIRDDGHRSLANRIFSNFITVLIVVNIATVLLDLLEVIPAQFEPVFFWLEVVTVIIFTIEYILRLWTADMLYSQLHPFRARLKYAALPMSIVDVLAVIPFYLPFAFPINMTILRLLRLLRLFRVMKLNRYSDTKTAEVVLASISEAIVLIDTGHNFMSGNKAANELFPGLSTIKKYTAVTQIESWPEELSNISEGNIEDIVLFEMNNRYYRTKITSIHDREKLLRFILIIHDETDTILQERAEKERVKAVEELVTIMKNYGGGNFECEAGTREGDWAWATEALHSLRSNIVNVLNEISELTDAVSAGNFSGKADESNFTDSWAKFVRKLNELIEAVEVPLSDIEQNVVRMSEGDFSVLSGNYKGKFGTVINACNRTNEITLSYIKEIAEVLGKISRGDLTASVKLDYIGSYAPIKSALDTILRSLNSTMADIRGVTEEVASGAEQISLSATQLAENSASQNAAVSELTVAIEKIDTRAKESAESATDANNRAERSAAAAKLGENAIQSMHVSMDKVKESSHDISELNKVIADISFQTTLLALNASIEAARAGEQGKGFSVVAEEVRNLADRSRESTDSSTEIILANRQSAESAATAAKDVTDSFASIAANISKMSEIIATIAEKSDEQAESISAVNAGISEISEVIQQNSASAEESASASLGLSQQAEMLRQLVSFFKLRGA
ncbi:MAG: methyl-accepting chemotaxis protein [Defluviitaleaceae bacterium]|nr:methyl-accepting chemotaxis protein [Defluviitaleaceae bacterium]